MHIITRKYGKNCINAYIFFFIDINNVINVKTAVVNPIPVYHIFLTLFSAKFSTANNSIQIKIECYFMVPMYYVCICVNYKG